MVGLFYIWNYKAGCETSSPILTLTPYAAALFVAIGAYFSQKNKKSLLALSVAVIVGVVAFVVINRGLLVAGLGLCNWTLY